MPERSFFYNGKQFPVCARCTGVFFGELCAVLLGLFKQHISNGLAAGFLLIMGGDWFIQEVHIKESTNIRRLITGFFGGFGLVCLYINILRWCFNIIKSCAYK